MNGKSSLTNFFKRKAVEAQGEVIRADGVAKANKIIGQSLKNNEDYLRYLWIHSMGDTKNQVIYVPTETGLPILEAGKRTNQKLISVTLATVRG